MSSRRGLPDFRKMRHDRHFVDELANHSVTGIGLMIPVEAIETNREQPRSSMGDLDELAASIRARGVLEPLLVRRRSDGAGYQLIAGERRYQAARQAGLHEVPCIELTATDVEAVEIALIENLQRKDLSPFEEAEGYRTLVEKYHYTHAQVSESIGKARSTVTDALKLLAIPPGIRDLCRHADITAKSVLMLIARADSIDEMERLVQEIAENRLDREMARLAAKHAPDAAGEAESFEGAGAARGGSFKPIQLRFHDDADPGVRFAFSIRRPGVSREALVRTLELLLERLRAGEFDERLTAKQDEGE